MPMQKFRSPGVEVICCRCDYFEATTNDPHLDESVGLCHRYAPSSFGGWPDVKAVGWCGEFLES